MYSGAFKVGSKRRKRADNRPQSGRFGLSFTRYFIPKRKATGNKISAVTYYRSGLVETAVLVAR